MQFCPECDAPNIDEDDQTMGLTQQFETLEKGTNTNNKIHWAVGDRNGADSL